MTVWGGGGERGGGKGLYGGDTGFGCTSEKKSGKKQGREEDLKKSGRERWGWGWEKVLIG